MKHLFNWIKSAKFKLWFPDAWEMIVFVTQFISSTYLYIGCFWQLPDVKICFMCNFVKVRYTFKILNSQSWYNEIKNQFLPSSASKWRNTAKLGKANFTSSMRRPHIIQELNFITVKNFHKLDFFLHSTELSSYW